MTIPSTEWFHFLIFELGLPHTDFSSLHLCSCSWLGGEALPFFSLIAIFQPLPPSLSAVRGTSLASYFKFNCCFQPAMQTPAWPLPGSWVAPPSSAGLVFLLLAFTLILLNHTSFLQKDAWKIKFLSSSMSQNYFACMLG